MSMILVGFALAAQMLLSQALAAPAPLFTCEVLERSARGAVAPGLEVSRCQALPTALGYYDQLRIEVSSPTLPPHWAGGGTFVWISLNLTTGLYPMYCFETDETPTCVATIASLPHAGLRAEDGPTIDASLFRYARRSNGSVSNAWDVEVAFTNAQGDWISNYGQNFRLRFQERRLSH